MHRRGVDNLEAEMLSFSHDCDRDVDGRQTGSTRQSGL
jgi:hypothetical protein